MLRFILASITGLAVSAALALNTAHAQDILVSAYHLDMIENPSEPARWWKQINPQDGEAILNTIATDYGYPGGGTTVINTVNAVIGHSDHGEDHKGWFQSPVGYTVCSAYVQNPSVNCNGTFAGSYRSADDPNSGGIDGLHYYIVVPVPNIGGGRCWAEGTVVITFVNAIKKPQFPCHRSGEIAFHYGR